MALTQELKGNASGAVKAIQDLTKAVSLTEKEFLDSVKAANQLKGAARRVAETADPQKKYNRELAGLAKLVREGKISLEEAAVTAQRFGDRLQRAGTKGKISMVAVQQQMLALASTMIGGSGIQGALAQINRSYETWLTNTREISSETIKAQNEIIAFAALQEGGTKGQRVARAAALATQFGIQDRGEAFNTVQALQSARGGDIEAGFAGARTVFQATQVGIPVGLGRELEVLGAGQGQAPGQAIRRAFVAGQESSRDPAALARAAPALTFFSDKDFGFAAAGVLAGGVRETELPTFVKAAGEGLSSVGTAAASFEKAGVGKDATQRQRLEKLAELNIDTTEKLKAFGFTNVRAQQGLAALVPNIEDINRIEAAIIEKAVPGLFGAQRAAVEAELPNQKLARQISVLRSGAKDEQAFGDSARGALLEEREQLIRGQVFRRHGIEQIFGKDVIDEEGRSTDFDQFLVSAVTGSQTNAAMLAEMRAARESLERGEANLQVTGARQE